MHADLMLTRYWITFDNSDRELIARYSLGLGAGVTAFNEADAIKLLKEALAAEALPSVTEFRSDVQIDELERNHVQLNLGNPAVRGVWYPALNL